METFAELKARMQKALGNDLYGEVMKRFSSVHKAGVMRVGHYLGKAMGTHRTGMMETNKAIAAHSKAIECCAKAAEAMGKAAALHKAHFGKAATASESTNYPHVEVAGHLENAHKALQEGLEQHMKALGMAHKAAHTAHLDTHDSHEMAKNYVTKVTGSWVGEESESPSSPGPGYNPSQAGHTSNMPQSTVTEGDVPDYDPFSPYPKTAGAGMGGGNGQVTEAEAQLRERLAKLEGERDALKAAVEANGNRPTDPKGRLFAVPTPGTGSDSADPVVRAIHKLHQAGKVTDIELQNMNDPDIRMRLTAKVLGYQAVAHEVQEPALADSSFAKSISHPAYRSDPSMIGKAAGAGIFNPNK